MSVEALRVPAHKQQRDAAIEERRLSLRAHASVLRSKTEAPTRRARTNGAERFIRAGPIIGLVYNSPALDLPKTNPPTTDPAAHSKETVTPELCTDGA